MNLRFGNLTFRLSIVPTIIFLSLLYLLISLGFWQLSRSEEKKALLEQQSQRSRDKIIDLSGQTNGKAEEFRYREARASGKYDHSHQFLIDNQVVDGKAGYYVMTPLILNGSNKAVLVNRGWIPLNKDRTVLPDVSFDVAEVDISGRIDLFPSVGYKLKGAEIPTDGWPSVVQLIDKMVLEDRLGYSIFPFQLQLGQDQANGYRRNWRDAVTIRPEKHKAYAFQWFGLAVTLVILFFWVSSRKKTNE